MASLPPVRPDIVDTIRTEHSGRATRTGGRFDDLSRDLRAGEREANRRQREYEDSNRDLDDANDRGRDNCE